MKNWFEIENKAPNEVSISIVGDIGSNGISAQMFKESLEKHADAKFISFDIYSQGGNMYDGLYMFDYLSQHPAYKTGRVINIAASAATLPLMAMDVVNMPVNSKIMIHQPQAFIRGATSDILRKAANHMDDMQSVAIEIYQHKTKLDHDVLEQMINAETYLTAQEAKKLGFADIISNQFEVKNQAYEIENIRDLEKFLRDSGHSRSKAIEIVAKIKTSLQRESADHVDIQQIAELSQKLSGLTIPKSLI